MTVVSRAWFRPWPHHITKSSFEIGVLGHFQSCDLVALEIVDMQSHGAVQLKLQTQASPKVVCRCEDAAGHPHALGRFCGTVGRICGISGRSVECSPSFGPKDMR